MGRIATRPRSLSDLNVLASGDPFESVEITSFVGSDYVGSEVSLLLGGVVGMELDYDGGGRWEAEFWVYYGFLFLLLDLFIDRSDSPDRPRILWRNRRTVLY